MSLTVQNLRAVGIGVEPTSLLPGQIAFNLTDKVIYVGDGSNFNTSFNGTRVPGVAGGGWYSMPMDFDAIGDYFVANPAQYGDTPTDQQVLTWSTPLNHPIWTSNGGGGSFVYITSNSAVASAPGATPSDKISAAIGVASPNEGNVTIVTGLPNDVYQGLYFFTTQWNKGASYAYPSASKVIYDNTSHPTLTPTVQGAIDDLDDGLIATTTIANTANSTANSALGIANAALPKAGGTMTGAIVSQNINIQPSYGVLFAGGTNGTQNGISDSTGTTSSTIAASSSAVKSAYDLANAALARSGGTMTGTITFVSGQVFPVSGIQDATTTQKGIVQVGTNIDVASGVISVKTADVSNLGLVRVGTNIDVASGTISVKTADTSNLGLVRVGTNIDVASGAISVKTADASNLGLVRVGSNVDVTSGVISVKTGSASNLGLLQVGSNLDIAAGVVSVRSSSTTQPGIVQLNNTTASPSITEALTAAQGLNLQSQINSLTVASNTTLAGSLDCATGLVNSVTTDGISKGFAIGSAPPLPTAGNANYYLIVTVASASYSPPGGGGPYAPQNGDWFLSNGTAWQYLGVGARPQYATTSTAGIVQLADNSTTQAGVNGTLAVTPLGLQSKVSDSTSTTSSISIASSTAVKSAYDLANAALPKSGGTMTGDITMSGSGVGIVFNNASTVEAISDSVSSTSSVTAASSTAVKSAYDIGNAALPKVGGTMTGDLTFSGANVGVVFNDTSTVEAISNSTSTTSSVTAASSTAVKSAYDLANAALARSGGTMTGAITFVTGQTFPVTGIQDATTSQKGVVQIGTNINVASGIISVPAATTGAQGAVQVGTNIQVSSGTISVNTATTGQLGLVQVGSNVDVSSGTISVKSSSTSQAGVVQLNDTVTSTSTTQALTANQGKSLQDQINALAISSNITFAGTINGSTGNMVTVTAEGAGVGFTVGSPLPSPSSVVAEFFVIVSTAGTMTPPGGSATAVQVGDWWLASALTWTYVAAGYTPPAASTTTAGIVELATDAETQAGVNSVNAVVPSALQSKVSDSTSTVSSTTIASSTAVKSAYDLGNAALPKAGGTMSGTITFAGGQTFPVSGIQSASTTQPGVVQLNNTTSSTSVTQALTANQGKSLQDQIDSLVVTNNITLAGTFNATTGLVDSVTTAGAAKGFVVGQALPAPAPANANYFVIIDVTGNTGPSGTPPYHVGDWWLSNGSVWQFLNVGYQPPTATTTQEGVVTLATTAQTQAGTNTSNAVTPSAAAATYLPLAGGSMGGDIILFNQVPPTSSSPASKYYADQISAGVKPQQAVAAATTAALVGTVTYNNGTAGVGATLTLSTPITTLDGVTITTVGTRVLIKNQASAFQNGVYTYTSGGATTILTRATDANTPALLPAGASYYITSGTVNGTQTYVQYTTVATIGSSAISYSLTSTKPFHKYSQEWNVDPIAGDDVNGTGSEEQPYLTIAKALLSAGNTGGRVILHQGNYNENITIPNLNLDITAANRSGATITGTVAYTAASSSVRIYGVSFTNTVTHSGAGSLYIQAYTSNSAINKTGSGYLELDDGAHDSGSLSITGAGYVNYFNSRVGSVTVNNAAAVYTAQNMSFSGPITVTTGTAQLILNSIITATESSNGITAAAGTTVVLKNTSVFTPSGVSGRVALSGNYSLNDAAFDRANSTLGTNLAGVFRFDAIDNFGPYYANGSAGTAGQILVSAGTGSAPVWTSSGTATANYGSFVRTTTQTNTGGASGNAVSYNTTSSANNFSIVSGSRITAAVAGTYQILASLQVQKTDGGTDEIHFWIKKNGVNEPNSAYNLTLAGSGAAQLGYINWVVTLSAGEYVELWWYSADVNARLLADPAVAPYPAVPASGFIIHPMGA